MTEYQEPIPQGQTNTMAVISLIAGIIGVLSFLVGLCMPCVLFFSLITGAAGAIFGFMAKKRIEESMGAETGRGLAIGGLVTGLISGICSIALVVIYLAIAGAFHWRWRFDPHFGR